MPSLDVQAFQAQLQAGKLAPVYLIVGEDVRLAERLVDALEATIDPADRPFAVDRLYAGDPGGSPVDIAASARGLPMLGDRRITIVLRAERLLKPKRGGKADDDGGDGEGGGDEAATDTSALEDYFADPVPSTSLVLVAAAVDRTRRLAKRLLERAVVVECGGLSTENAAARRDAHAAAAGWVREELTRAGRTIDAEAVRLLVDRTGLDISILRGDVERLILYTEGRSAVTAEDVDEVASTSASLEDPWAVVNAIGDGDLPRALREVARRLDRGESPHGLVGQLRWWVSNRLAEAQPERVAAALDALLRTDLALKSSGGDERALVERLVIEVTGRPVAQRGWR